jgi:hypothetical protein
LKHLIALAVLTVVSAAPAHAQPQPHTTTTTNADRLELSVGYWRPSAVIHAAGESGGVQGTPIDFHSDFGLEDRGFPQLQFAVRVTRRNGLSLGYVPIRYDATAALGRDVLFANARYPAGVQTQGIVSWNALRFGYTFDVVVRPKLTVGVVGEIDRTNVQVRLKNATSASSTSSSVPTIPGIGAAAKFRVARRVTISALASGLYVPDRKDEIYGGHFFIADSHATWAVTPHVGASVGYQLIDIRHLGEADSGTFRLHGLTVGAVVTR